MYERFNNKDSHKFFYKIKLTLTVFIIFFSRQNKIERVILNSTDNMVQKAFSTNAGFEHEGLLYMISNSEKKVIVMTKPMKIDNLKSWMILEEIPFEKFLSCSRHPGIYLII